MGFLKKLGSIFGGSSGGSSDSGGFYLYIKCNRCGEVIETRVNLFNDLSVEYSETGSVDAYYCRKVLVGANRCYQPIEVGLQFDSRRKLVDKTVSGGQFVDGPEEAAPESQPVR
jgi:hypothetical protein